MYRTIEKKLLDWKRDPNRLALLIRGARQVGKSYTIEKFGREHFKSSLTINLEQFPEYRACFETLDPQKILTAIELLSGKTITPGETLLFLDEIQEAPRAIMALRYFKEQLPQLHVIGAGSLLECALQSAHFRMPVGRVQFLYLRPLSFIEYLEARGNNSLVNHLREVNLSEAIESAVHQRLLAHVREYWALGGMPAVIKRYRETENLSQCQEIQSALLATYRSDFGKYANSNQYRHLETVFAKAPGMIAQWVKYSKIDREVRIESLKNALKKLSQAGLISLIYATSGAGLPLITHMNEKKFKLLFLDTGLAKRAANLDLKMLFEKELSLINKGALAEQFVGQELLAYFHEEGSNELFFWCREQRNSSAEVDYLHPVEGKVIPIEVKAGAIGSLRSLHLFLKERRAPIGVRISEAPFAYREGILSLPFYLISQLPRLTKEALIDTL